MQQNFWENSRTFKVNRARNVSIIALIVVFAMLFTFGATYAYFSDVIDTNSTTLTFGTLDCKTSINNLQYQDSVTLNLSDYTDRQILVNSAKFYFTEGSVDAYLRVAVGYRAVNVDIIADEQTCVALNSEIGSYNTFSCAEYYWQFYNGYYYLIDTSTNLPYTYTDAGEDEFMLFEGSNTLSIPDLDKFNLSEQAKTLDGVQIFMQAQAVQAANMPIVDSIERLDTIINTANIFTNPIINYGYIIKYNTLGGTTVDSHIVMNQSSITIPMVADREVAWYNEDNYEDGAFSGDALYISNQVVQTTNIKDNLTLVASYSAEGYTVFFESDADSGSVPASAVINSENNTVSYTTLNKGGYNHTGWKVKGSSPEVIIPATTNTLTFDVNAYALGTAITLVPVWTPLEYIATFTTDTEKGYIVENSGSTYQVVYTIETKWNVDAGKLFPTVQCVTTDYVFLGWRVTQIASGCDVHFKLNDVLTHYQNGIYGLTQFEAVFASTTSGGGGGGTASSGKISIADVSISSIADQVFTGRAIKPTLTLTYDNAALALNTDYKVAYFDNVNAGTAHALITGAGDFEGTLYVDFYIAPCELTSATVTVGDASYTGKPVTPSVEVVMNDVTLPSTSYTLTYYNNVEPGTDTASVVVQGLGNLSGFKTATFSITALNISQTTLTIDNAVYTGNAIVPNVQVKYNGEILDSSVYTVSCTNNINVGTANVTVTGKGSLTGTKTGTFTISNATISGTIEQSGSLSYNGGAQRPSLSNSLVSYGGQAITVTYSTNNSSFSTTVPTFTAVGQHTLYWKAVANYHNTRTGSATITIGNKSLSASTVFVQAIPSQSYCGLPITLSPNDVVITDSGNTLVYGQDYTISGYENNTSTGTATVYIVALSTGNYTGQISKTFTIVAGTSYSYLYFEDDALHAGGWVVSYNSGTLPTTLTIPDYVVKSGSTFYKANAGVSGAKPVTSIAPSGFEAQTTLQYVNFPNTLLDINARAFYGCTALKSITIPDSVVLIGDYAFYNHTAVTTITIGKGVQTIGSYAFQAVTGTDALLTLNYNAINCTSFSGSGVFGYCGNASNNRAAINIGAGVQRIPGYFYGRSAFFGKVTFIDMSSLTYIGSNAFLYSTSNSYYISSVSGWISSTWKIDGSNTSITDDSNACGYLVSDYYSSCTWTRVS